MVKWRPSSAPWALIPSKMARTRPPLAREAATSFTISTYGGQKSKWRMKIGLVATKSLCRYPYSDPPG